MKIYDYEGFPNPERVRIALREKGLADRVTFVRVDVPAGEHRTPAFLARNPDGTVPVLELEDGTCIAESTAITEYLDHLVGEPVLTGRTPRERALIHMMQRRAEAGLLDAVSAYFHHATPGLGPAIARYRCPEWGLHSRERAIATLRALDRLLADRLHLAGEAFTVADITAYAGLAFADIAGVAMPEELDRLAAWRARVAARPSVVGR